MDVQLKACCGCVGVCGCLWVGGCVGVGVGVFPCGVWAWACMRLCVWEGREGVSEWVGGRRRVSASVCGGGGRGVFF